MQSHGLTLSGSSSNKEISKTAPCKPSEIFVSYPATLQDVIMRSCPTVDKSADVWSPTIGMLSEAFPKHSVSGTEEMADDLAVSWMRTHIAAVGGFVGVREKLNEWQMSALCNQLISTYPQTTLMEFVLFCARLRSGWYDKFYGSIDPMRVLTSFAEFYRDKQRDKWRHEDEERQKREDDERQAARAQAAENYKKFRNAMDDGRYPNLRALETRGATVIQCNGEITIGGTLSGNTRRAEAGHAHRNIRHGSGNTDQLPLTDFN